MHYVKGQVALQAHVALPKGTVEEEFGREGFFGPVTHLYRAHAPTGWTRIEGPLRPHALYTERLEKADGQRTTLLSNDDVALQVARLKRPMDHYFRNADAEELYFVHFGNGAMETDFGPLRYRQGDYIVIPRGTTYRIHPDDGEETYFLIIEGQGPIRQPDRGILGQHALYDPAIIRTPTPAPVLDQPGEYEVRIKQQGQYTSVYYPYHPMDVVGWKGDLTVWQLNLDDIRPVLSHRAHLPPPVHTTWVGKGWVVCSFLPRPLEEDPEAVRVPFYHRNIDYDEVLFYHDGDFFSRDGIEAGMITFHPMGIHHGPHPKAIAASLKKTHTDEKAVMLDTRRPLRLSPQAEAIEWQEYWQTWQS